MGLLYCRPCVQLLFVAVLLKRRTHNASTYLPGIVNRGAAFGNRRPTSFGLLGVWLRVWCLPLCLLPTGLLLSTRLCLSARVWLWLRLSSTRVGLGWSGLAAWLAAVVAADCLDNLRVKS